MAPSTSAPPDYNQAAEEVDKVQKRQRTAEAKVDSCLDQLIKQVAAARDELARSGQQGGSADTEERVSKLRVTVDSLLKEANSSTKELHSAIGKLSKVVDACVDEVVDLGRVMRNVTWNPHTLHTIIAQHFYRQGRFQVGDMMVREAELHNRDTLAAPFTAMHDVLEQIQAHNLEPALQWASAQLLLLDMGALAPGWPSHAPSSHGPSHASWADAAASNRAEMAAVAAAAAAAAAVAAAAGGEGAAVGADGRGAGRGTDGGAAARAASAVAAIQAFQFKLHSLNFLNLLVNQGQEQALRYAREHFTPFASSHMRDIQQLMGCMVYCARARASATAAALGLQGAGSGGGGGAAAAVRTGTPGRSGRAGGARSVTAATAGGPAGDVVMGDATAGAAGAGAGTGAGAGGVGGLLAGTPYAHLMGADAWEAAAGEFSRLACSLVGMAAESPLSTVVAAGAAALPVLHKLMSVLSAGVAAELRGTDQLPVELELGAEFVFHPIFACPVSRDQSTADNPPLLLPCNHVLCEQSVFKIAKNRTRVFKCPYCPVEARVDNLRPLVFPPLE